MDVYEVWARMAELYGERWTSLMGDEPNEMWAAGVASCTERQLAKGFERLLEEGAKDGHPPSLPRFIGLCKRSEPGYYGRSQALPEPAFTFSQRVANTFLLGAVLNHACVKFGPHISEDKMKTVVVPAMRKIVKEGDELERAGGLPEEVKAFVRKGLELNVIPLL
jgi:hypothetical protein